MACIFCAIAKKEIPAELLYEDDLLVAFADINPVAPTHILIIPREHCAGLSETENEVILARLLKTARALSAEMNIHDYRLVINNGPRAGQTVFHLHLHLLAGRDFSWPPG